MAGTIIQKMQSFGSRRDGTTMFKFSLSCTGDLVTGTFPVTALGFKRQLRGCRLESVEVTSGIPVPEQLWSLEITDSAGYDLLGGNGHYINIATPQRLYPATSGSPNTRVPINGDTFVVITENNVSLAKISLEIYFSR